MQYVAVTLCVTHHTIFGTRICHAFYLDGVYGLPMPQDMTQYVTRSTKFTSRIHQSLCHRVYVHAFTVALRYASKGPTILPLRGRLEVFSLKKVLLTHQQEIFFLCSSICICFQN